MSSLVKCENINMSDSPIVIEVDGCETNENIETVLNENSDEHLSADINETNEELSESEVKNIKENEQKAKLNAKKIEEEAFKKAERIIFEAQNEADKIKVQSQRELNHQIDEIKKNAIIKAKAEAKEAVLKNIELMDQKLETALQDLEKNQKAFFITLEKNLPQFALEIAGKILFKKVTQSPEEMDMLIKNTIAGIKGATWIDVKVGESLNEVAKGILDEMAQNLKDRGTTLDVNPVKENNWEVVAESDKGIIDSSINTQIQNLMEFIETYQKKQGE